MSIETMLDFSTRRFEDCKASFSQMALRKAIEESAERKSRLNEIFGLDYSNDFTFAMPLEASEYDIRNAYVYTSRLIEYLLRLQFNDIPAFSLKANTVSLRTGDTKLTRYLTKFSDTISKSDYFSNALQELSREGASKTETWQDFICRLGEMKNSATSELFITTAISEFWGVNWNSSYRSCLRHKNETDTSYFTGTSAFGMDNFTMLVGVRRKADKYKLGRSWIHVFPDGVDTQGNDHETPFMVQVKSYGEFSSEMRTQVREWMQKKINAATGFSNDWSRCSLSSVIETHSHGYIDNYDLSLSYAKGGSRPTDIRMDFSEVIPCLNCGDIVEDATEGSSLCDSCQDDYYTSCCHCEEIIHDEGDAYFVAGEGEMCCSCFNERFFTCHECNENHSVDERYEVHIDGRRRYICEDCYDNYSECSICGDSFSNVHMVESVEGNDICPDCAEGYCDECGLYFEPSSESIDLPDGRSLCTSCRDEQMDKCSECGEYFLNEDLDEGCMCASCAESLEEEGEPELKEAA